MSGRIYYGRAARNGEWIEPKPQRIHYIRCCDCGLTHRFEFRVRGGKIQFRAWRDERRTAGTRRRKRAAIKGVGSGR